MRSLIAIAALLASVSASAAELDGKAILCQRDDYAGLPPYGYEFRDGKVYPHYVSTIDGGTRAIVATGEGVVDPYVYTAKVDVVEWDVGSYVLDRKTLAISKSSLLDMAVLFTLTCELSPSVGAMKQAMEMHRQDKQRQIDAEMEGNKI